MQNEKCANSYLYIIYATVDCLGSKSGLRATFKFLFSEGRSARPNYPAVLRSS